MCPGIKYKGISLLVDLQKIIICEHVCVCVLKAIPFRFLFINIENIRNESIVFTLLIRKTCYFKNNFENVIHEYFYYILYAFH